MRAFSSLPIAGAHEDFAVACALFAMKFVNRHEGTIIGRTKISSVKRERKSTHCESRGNETCSKKPKTPYVVSCNFKATIFRGAANDRGSNGSTPRRWCRQKAISVPAIQCARRKRPRWLCLDGAKKALEQADRDTARLASASKALRRHILHCRNHKNHHPEPSFRWDSQFLIPALAELKWLTFQTACRCPANLYRFCHCAFRRCYSHKNYNLGLTENWPDVSTMDISKFRLNQMMLRANCFLFPAHVPKRWSKSRNDLDSCLCQNLDWCRADKRDCHRQIVVTPDQVGGRY